MKQAEVKVERRFDCLDLSLGLSLNLSVSCRSLRHTSYSLTSLRDAGSALPLLEPRADSSSAAGAAHADHGRIGGRPPNRQIRPGEIRQWAASSTSLPRVRIE